MEISRETFEQQRTPRFGNANPERMKLAFWEWMIRGDDVPPAESKRLLGQLGLLMREGLLRSAYGPYRARDLFNVPQNREEGPIWTFDRMGATRSPLPDGRLVCVGGEHEDFYDPDFHIYNDVIVLGTYEQIDIYGYQREVFAPTDFHTATLLGDQIVVIGGIGYPKDRRPEYTPVYAIDLSQFSIHKIETSGEMPGWISEHDANYDPKGIITIKAGQVAQERGGKQCFRRNFEDYALDIRSWVWQRTTNRNWREFSIRQEKGAFLLDKKPKPEALLPRDIENAILPDDGKQDARFSVAGVPVSVTIGISRIAVVVEGSLPETLSAQVVEEIRSNAEAAIQRRCIADQT